mgnify:FL=1
MASVELLELLRRGAPHWNEWRAANLPDSDCDKFIDLRGAQLDGLNLAGIDLRYAVLYEATLRGTNLKGANLKKADIRQARLDQADLSETDLFQTNLSGSRLERVALRRAKLINSLLLRTDLLEADFQDACFDEVWLFETAFINTNLTGATGLETCFHAGPSTVDVRTIQRSGMLPGKFLRGCGVSEEFLHYLSSLLNQPVQFYSCFISYSHEDKAFARLLHDRLQGQGIRCWLDEHQLLPGDDLHEGIDRGIRLWDKVLLCAS